MNASLLLFAEYQLKLPDHQRDLTRQDKGQVDAAVEHEQHEELPVPEAHAVTDPRAVVIHVEVTLFTGRAVVRPLWLESVTDHAVLPGNLVIFGLLNHVPERVHFAGVRDHTHRQRPKQ